MQSGVVRDPRHRARPPVPGGSATYGLSLAESFYRRAVRPLVEPVPHAAALLGDGSEVLGYDDATSADHDFGPRVQVFVADAADIAPVMDRLRALPAQFDGLATEFVDHDAHGGVAHHQVEVTTAAAFFTERLGVDPAGGMSLRDWLLAPTQRLATLTAGAVFRDPDGALGSRREALRWYPDDVWRYALASAWLRVSQEEAFVGRTAAIGDDLGSRVVAARLAREFMRLTLLIERRWAPYSKWLGRAFGQCRLATGTGVGAGVAAILAADDWRARERAVCAVGQALGEATNALGLAEVVDPRPRQYYDRAIRVVGGERFTVALTAAITAPDVTALLARLGNRPGAAVGTLPGTIDQAVDSTDVLTHPGRCRAAAPLLGLAPERE